MKFESFLPDSSYFLSKCLYTYMTKVQMFGIYSILYNSTYCLLVYIQLRKTPYFFLLFDFLIRCFVFILNFRTKKMKSFFIIDDFIFRTWTCAHTNYSFKKDVIKTYCMHFVNQKCQYEQMCTQLARYMTISVFFQEASLLSHQTVYIYLFEWLYLKAKDKQEIFQYFYRNNLRKTNKKLCLNSAATCNFVNQL